MFFFNRSLNITHNFYFARGGDSPRANTSYKVDNVEKVDNYNYKKSTKKPLSKSGFFLACQVDFRFFLIKFAYF